MRRLYVSKPTFLRFFALIMCAIISLQSNASSEGEKQIRAMFVYNFANFVQWPNRAFKHKNSPLQVCLLGEVPFVPYLMPMSGTLIGKRELRVSQETSEKDFSGQCHMLFIGPQEKGFKPSKKYLYILSISEQPDFIERGGIVHIIDQVERISFDIELDRAKRQGLFISSDLLSLARNIKRLNRDE